MISLISTTSLHHPFVITSENMPIVLTPRRIDFRVEPQGLGSFYLDPAGYGRFGFRVAASSHDSKGGFLVEDAS